MKNVHLYMICGRAGFCHRHAGRTRSSARYATFAQTLDTADFVPEKYNKKILAYIFRNMKRQFRNIDREDRRYQRAVRKKERLKAKQKAKDGQ